MLAFYQVWNKSVLLYHNHRDIRFKPHYHKELEIVYMRKGQQRILIDQKEYILQEGETAVIFPYQVHEYTREEKETADQVIIIVSMEYFRHYFSDITNKVPLNPVIKESALHQDAYYALSHIETTDPENIQDALVILSISRIFEQLKYVQTPKVYVNDLSYRITEYMRNNFMEPLTLGMVATEFSVNKNYISKVFSSKLHMGFRTYLGCIRSEYAAMLLRTTDEKIASIAKQSGFESQRSFNRVFTEIYGSTPKEFREKLTQ